MLQKSMERSNMKKDFFHLTERGTTVRREVLAGITTFMTMAYVLAVQPAVICGFGPDAAITDINGVVISKSALLVMCALVSGVITLYINIYKEVTFMTNYQELAEHYGTAILPARVRAPKDKAAVEGTVGVISTFILTVLRHR